MGKPYILIAEDDHSLKTVIAETFRFAGFEVGATGNGSEVIPMIEGRQPDAIILDVAMPGKNGFEICRELRGRECGRTLPIVLLTARAADTDRHWGIDAGADEYLTKPFDPDSLIATVSGLIESRLRGDERNPLTKTPDLSSVVRRALELVSLGERLEAVAIEFEPEPAAVYRQKYGDLRFADAIRIGAACLRQALAASVIHTPKSEVPAPLFLGHAGDVSYSRFALVGAPSMVRDAVDRASAFLNDRVLDLYDATDRERGFVAVRESAGGFAQVPLLAFRAEVVNLDTLATEKGAVERVGAGYSQ